MDPPDLRTPPSILLTGATGYIGGRLLNRLETLGHRVRCLSRHPESLAPRVASSTEVMYADMLDPSSLRSAMKGDSVAYYLVHSMGSVGSFEENDRQAAENFGKVARECGVKRIIYLGGLGDSSMKLSPHLQSRQEVGHVLREFALGVQVIEFRASIVLGSGSLSFEMIRALVERLPVMITPKWVSIPTQPIAINDLLEYLLLAMNHNVEKNRIYEIGGTDQLSYGDLMKEYAKKRGLRRLMIPVPVLTPRLSSLWLGLVTPLYARVGRKLIDSLRYPTVVRDLSALREFPIKPQSVRQAITNALKNEDEAIAATRWSDALSAAGELRVWQSVHFRSRLIDSRAVTVDVDPTSAFRPIARIGGATGWYYANWLWGLRGFLDLLVGGVGIRRGRRDPDWIRVGDTVDCWRVEAVEPNRRLRLFAEMKFPGRAWLEFQVEPSGSGSIIRQTAIFDPVGIGGLAYWYAVSPLHKLVFPGMLRSIAAVAESSTNQFLAAKNAMRSTR
ncbi:MAG: SDR family oxidoreductase [Nitrospirales bacterium]